MTKPREFETATVGRAGWVQTAIAPPPDTSLYRVRYEARLTDAEAMRLCECLRAHGFSGQVVRVVEDRP